MKKNWTLITNEITFSKLQVFLKMCLDHKKILGKQE